MRWHEVVSNEILAHAKSQSTKVSGGILEKRSIIAILATTQEVTKVVEEAFTAYAKAAQISVLHALLCMMWLQELNIIAI